MDERTLRLTAFFGDPARFQAASGEFARSGRQCDCFLPWPLHGLDAELGLERSWIGRPVLALILLGMAAGLGLCWYTQVLDYPLVVGGKPFFAWPTFVVVILESGLMCGALATMALALHTARLRPDATTLLIDDRITDDLFCLVVGLRAEDDPARLRQRLAELGAERIELQGGIPAADGEAGHG